MQVSSAEILYSPTVLFETPRSSCGLLLTWCVSREPKPLFSLSPLVVILYEPLPVLPFVPAPFCAVKPPILFGPVGLVSRTVPEPFSDSITEIA